MLEKMNQITALNDELGRMLYETNEVLPMTEHQYTRPLDYRCERCEVAKATHEFTATDEDGDLYYTMLCDACAEIEGQNNGLADYLDQGNPNLGKDGKPSYLTLWTVNGRRTR